MKLIILLIGFIFVFKIQLLSQEKSLPFSIDSNIVFKLQIHLDSILSDPADILKVDSARWTLIDNKKCYSKIIVKNSISVDSLIEITESPIEFEFKIKNYSYVFDYLIAKGLDFNYDYYTLFEYRIQDNVYVYVNRLKSKEYHDKKRLLNIYFKIYKKYKRLYNLRQPSNDIIGSLIKFGQYNYPLLTYKILKLSPPLDEDVFNIKLRELWK
jgi:hypothetical protein